MMSSFKIFCIGFPKTGTSSMRAALEVLGFSVHGPFGLRDPKIAENAWSGAKQLVALYDAFEDDPWPQLYKDLDSTYPGSKFILTVRDPASWLNSLLRHCGDTSSPMREWVFGAGNPVGYEHQYLETYNRHNAEVEHYFSGREGVDFLVMNLLEGDGWAPLCSFLNKQLPDQTPFPHRNRAEERRLEKRRIDKVSGVLKHMGRRFRSWQMRLRS